MLKNDSRVLKNGDRIFKSQVVDSYLTNNNPNSNNMYIGVSSLSESNPLNVYYKTPSSTIKQTRTTDNTNWLLSFPATSETSNKPYFFSGHLDGLYKIDFRNSNSYRYRGNLMEFINQFLRLETFDMDFDSEFSENLTNAVFPRTMKWLALRDATLSGSFDTIIGLQNLEHFEIYSGNFGGSVSDMGFTKLQYLELQNLYNILGDVTQIVNNNPNMTYWYVWNCYYMSGDITTMDVSNLLTMRWYAASNNNINGSMSGWTFNTGATEFTIYPRNFGGDITNLDISNTKMNQFQISNYNYYQNRMTGDLSGWILPNTINTLYLYGISGMTSMPQDFSNTHLSNLTFQYCFELSDDINDINFGTGLTGSMVIENSKMTGNLELFTPPPNVTQLRLRDSNFTGNLSGITIYSGLTNVYFDGNLLSGNTYDLQPFSNVLSRLELGQNADVYLDLDSGTFNTNNLNYLYLDSISGITGDWSNFVIDSTLYGLYLTSTPIDSDISKLDVSLIQNLQIGNCSLVSDITNWFTGTTNTTTFNCYGNSNLSGDTTNWDVNDIATFQVYSTSLYGALKHNNVYNMYIMSTNISSNIETDLNFSNLYYFAGYNTNMVGNLSGVTLNYNFYYFQVYSNPTIYGTNEFIDYLFTNRVLWSRANSYTDFRTLGDTASGATETTGATGTWSGSIWDLTEAYVNNLADGLDWDGNGSNTPWNPKQKMWWQKNAQISPTNTTKRYKLINILYS